MDPKSRSALGTVLSAIKAFCLVFIRFMNVAEDTVAMADKAVKAARKRQIVDVTISMADYVTKAREKAVLSQAKAKLEMDVFIGQDPERKALVNSIRTKLDELLKQELAELEVTEEN